MYSKKSSLTTNSCPLNNFQVQAKLFLRKQDIIVKAISMLSISGMTWHCVGVCFNTWNWLHGTSRVATTLLPVIEKQHVTPNFALQLSLVTKCHLRYTGAYSDCGYTFISHMSVSLLLSSKAWDIFLPSLVWIICRPEQHGDMLKSTCHCYTKWRQSYNCQRKSTLWLESATDCSI